MFFPKAKTDSCSHFFFYVLGCDEDGCIQATIGRILVILCCVVVPKKTYLGYLSLYFFLTHYLYYHPLKSVLRDVSFFFNRPRRAAAARGGYSVLTFHGSLRQAWKDNLEK